MIRFFKKNYIPSHHPPARGAGPSEKIEEIKEEITAPKKAVIGEAYKILRTPHITEKATDLVKKNQYVFKVFPEANKTEIKKAIEDLYGVDVESVKTINIPRKKRRLGRIKGWRKGYKKAIVKIKEGQKIEVMPK
ncbi:MAG: 50S ribosomal protein L23 [Candidatus Nealsonbacteria bacterium CG10_big_fil_rev_8_21_14_0_10_36_228]|uniref:Large ribosomal subunit protein uL23 n=4 Tax=Candidatus Nealsoniibacteriota TaxID=1817911 RepID=A0A2M8DLK1_9BACT|nr:MAG: 50S ribosomal protein L23 [Candidatus Nealsonbacteria bacterium CG23_combo_of_CG06-09_8_20_14_all_36_125]PIR72492.1 MAG: 50S ribosomal protein L23 [Candidatus Nealsonbacteria bacterium CG10_big_fil_rev_8_21_14_0_10_36_228]PIX88394.1 MAG: 50S ribosomal protein L23 [Candidatus Nealsonbacteria bacterium CG_4_10_14_3_um_filter_36_16]PJB98743.1 MAG: 50S ribosomal protein L23 [Candidatus Nealsonbacteria bacterium CG_4_9_14_0_8_um_filter_36_17]